jgi:hypothetical protein
MTTALVREVIHLFGDYVSRIAEALKDSEVSTPLAKTCTKARHLPA